MAAEAFPFELDVCNKCEATFRRPTPGMIGGLAIKPELRVVYRSHDGKHSLHPKTAMTRTARFLMRKEWPCNCWAGESDEFGRMYLPATACWLHWEGDNDEDPYSGADDSPTDHDGRRVPRMNAKIFERRVIRWLMWHDKRVRELGRSPFARKAGPT